MKRTRNKRLLNIFLILIVAMTMGISVGTALGKYIFSEKVGEFDLKIIQPAEELIYQEEVEEAVTDNIETDNTEGEENDATQNDIDISETP